MSKRSILRILFKGPYADERTGSGRAQAHWDAKLMSLTDGQPWKLIEQAILAVGEGDEASDWKLDPTRHAEMYRENAEPLARVLQGARPTGLAKMHVELDAKAVRARDHFKVTVSKSNYAVFSTLGLGALLLVSGGFKSSLGTLSSWIVGSIGLLAAVSGGLASMWISQTRGGNLLDKWARERAQAEAKRLEYFKAVIKETSEKPFPQLLALEYTRRFLLQNQINYFRERGNQHDEASNKALTTSTRSVFASSSLTAIAGLLAMWNPQLAVIAGFGVIASAYSSLAGSKSAVNLDRRNADRYRLAKDQLEERTLEIDIFRRRTAEGEKTAVEEFFNPVFIILAADHKKFLDDSSLKNLELLEIEGRLKSAQEGLRRFGKPEGGP